MSKEEFLIKLRKGLSGFPKDDIEERVSFYGEMIADLMEDGLSEEAAVAQIGTAEEIVSQITADIPLTKLVKEKIKPNRKLKVWETVLLALGSPVWFPVLLAVISVIISLYAVLLSVIISLWAGFASLAACALSGVAAGIYFAASCSFLSGAVITGAGIAAAGLTVFMFFICKAATKGILILTKKLAIAVKNCFRKKGEAQ